MATVLSQNDQLGRLTTPLGEDVLVLGSMNAAEALSELFDFRVQAVSLHPDVDFNSVLGQACAVSLKVGEGEDDYRYFHGVATEATWAGSEEDIYYYDIVLKPWLWLLTRTSDCRIFPRMTPIDIIKQVFSDRGFADFRDETHGSPPTPEYCVQYRETDFNFVCRLMETYGIYYFFEHDYKKKKHTLVLADSKSSHRALDKPATLPFNRFEHGGRADVQFVDRWSRGRSVQSGKYVLEDYGYKRPPANLLADSQRPGGYEHGSMEVFDYPYGYVDSEGKSFVDQHVGESFAKYRLEALQSLDDRRASQGFAPSLVPGALIRHEKNPVESENKEYLITRCSHFFGTEHYRSVAAGAGSRNRYYVGSYEMTPSDRQFRAPFVTRKPEIAGVQSALVITGQSGEEIDLDDEGRILVQFYWDRKKKPSRRVRVAQPWAGKERGALFNPRVGDEVMIAYEEGDPDRPIVVGSVYNGTNPESLKLPVRREVTGVLGKSSKTGGSTTRNANAWWFDDATDREQFYVRARKDMYMRVYNNENIRVGANVTETVGNNETINVGYPVGNNPPGAGEFTLNVLNKVTINVGPKGNPLTQLIMDTQSITLNVGPSGNLSQVVMDIKSIATQSTQIKETGKATISNDAPMVKINCGG
jgi:type VI secretion system secreted protein VgrG